MTTLERLYHLLNNAIGHEESGDLQEWFPEREAKGLLAELEPLAFPPPTTTASADGLNLLRPGDAHERMHANALAARQQEARSEPGAAYLAAMRAQLDNSASEFAKRHAIFCRGARCLFCNPKPELEKQFGDFQLALSKVSDKPHEGKQRALYDWRSGVWRVYTRDDGFTITGARDCSEHEASAVEAGKWVEP